MSPAHLQYRGKTVELEPGPQENASLLSLSVMVLMNLLSFVGALLWNSDNFLDTSLLLQNIERGRDLTCSKQFDSRLQYLVLSPHDLIEFRCPHSGLLHLFERSACLDALMLACIPDQQHTVLRSEASKKLTHYLLQVKKNRQSQLFYRSACHVPAESIMRRSKPISSALHCSCPEDSFSRKLKSTDLDLDDEEAIGFLSKRLHVSTAASARVSKTS
jgi:hypothetical protein